MRNYFLPTLCATAVLTGCCVAPTEPGAAPAAPVPAVALPPAVGAAATAAGAAPPATTSPAAALPGVSPPPAGGAAPTASAVPAAPAAPIPVGTLLAGGNQYAFEDVGITLRVPAGWTQQLMNDGSIALFSEDYPTKGKRDRGAMMLVSRYRGTLPKDDNKLAAALKKGLDPAATVEAGPLRLQIADKQAAQIVIRAADADGVKYGALYTIMEARGKAVAVKATAIDNLDRRKPLFDAVMESITITGPGGAR